MKTRRRIIVLTALIVALVLVGVSANGLWAGERTHEATETAPAAALAPVASVSETHGETWYLESWIPEDGVAGTTIAPLSATYGDNWYLEWWIPEDGVAKEGVASLSATYGENWYLEWWIPQH